MALFLIQHGKSLPKDQDPEQGLSPEGVADVQRIAGVAKVYGIRPVLIVHSGKMRARQTAEIFAKYLEPPGGISQRAGLGPLDDVATFAGTLRLDENLMAVGHLPFMERLAAYLVTGSEKRPVFRFQNGGIVCVDHYPDTGNPVIKWALMPRIG